MTYSDDDNRQAALDAVVNLVAGIDPGAMTVGFVLAAEVVDARGERALWLLDAPGQKAWQTHGYLDHALTVQRGDTAAQGAQGGPT